jgi:hypothetical protein
MGMPAETVILRSLCLSDAEVIARWAADPEFCRAADWTVDVPFAEHRRFHQDLIQSPPPDLMSVSEPRRCR